MPNVSEAGLRVYLIRFHDAYRSTAEHFFAAADREGLSRYPLLDHGIRGYVSTQFGAGFEYLPPPATGIVTVHHRSRVEFMLAGAPVAVRDTGPMVSIGGENTAIQGLTLDGAFPLLLTKREADVRLVDVRFRAGNWERIVVWAELYGDRSAERWSEASAVARANQELFLAYAEMSRAQAAHVSIHEYVHLFKERHVLVLGDYSGSGRARLTAIQTILRQANYVPVLLDELPDYPSMNLQQKAVTYGSVARFVVIDDSSKSGHLVEAVHVTNNDWIAIVVRLAGSDGSYMTKGISETSTVIHEVMYAPETLSTVLGTAIKWAEQRNDELGRHWSAVYPWRE